MYLAIYVNLFRASDSHIEKFERESVAVCEAMIKGRTEITETEALQRKYRDGLVSLVNYQTNRSEYVYVIFSLFQQSRIFLSVDVVGFAML